MLLPVYNADAYLAECLESLLSQTRSDFEILAIDDASTDRSPSILAEYAKKDPRVRVLSRPTNGGLVEALNWGLREATTRIVIRQDADDRSRPDRVEKSLAYLARFPETILLGTDITRMDEKGKPLGRQHFPSTDAEIRWQLLFRNPFAHSTVVFDREKALSMGGYSKSALHAEDYDLWTRLAPLGKMANLPEPLCEYRVHGESISSRHVREMETQSARIGADWLGHFSGVDGEFKKVWEKFRRRLPLSPRELEGLKVKLIALLLQNSELSEYPKKKAESDLSWHLLSYLKRRKEMVLRPFTILSLLKSAPSLINWPGSRWRTN